jgi:hypothetical protein
MPIIKLKKLLSEEKQAFKLEREGKLRFTYSESGGLIIITMLHADGYDLGYTTSPRIFIRRFYRS